VILTPLFLLCIYISFLGSPPGGARGGKVLPSPFLPAGRLESPLGTFNCQSTATSFHLITSSILFSILALFRFSPLGELEGENSSPPGGVRGGKTNAM